MGRRKKEPEGVHRDTIAAAAERLFSHRGIEAATMDDIAREAGYSKATLYVYFANKEEIVGFLVLKSMKLLCGCIDEAVSAPASARERYDRICRALAGYQEQYPLYFGFALGEINVDLEREGCLLVEKETFEVGEQINGRIAEFLLAGIHSGELKPDIPILPTVFLFWSSLAGLIQMAANKRLYIEKTMNLSRWQFLEFGFDRLYQLIAGEGA